MGCALCVKSTGCLSLPFAISTCGIDRPECRSPSVCNTNNDVYLDDEDDPGGLLPSSVFANKTPGRGTYGIVKRRRIVALFSTAAPFIASLIVTIVQVRSVKFFMNRS
jgi:hypothetical protein